jgi:hypothetical protein
MKTQKKTPQKNAPQKITESEARHRVAYLAGVPTTAGIASVLLGIPLRELDMSAADEDALVSVRPYTGTEEAGGRHDLWTIVVPHGASVQEIVGAVEAWATANYERATRGDAMSRRQQGALHVLRNIRVAQLKSQGKTGGQIRDKLKREGLPAVDLRKVTDAAMQAEADVRRTRARALRGHRRRGETGLPTT